MTNYYSLLSFSSRNPSSMLPSSSATGTPSSSYTTLLRSQIVAECSAKLGKQLNYIGNSVRNSTYSSPRSSSTVKCAKFEEKLKFSRPVNFGLGKVAVSVSTSSRSLLQYGTQSHLKDENLKTVKKSSNSQCYAQ